MRRCVELADSRTCMQSRQKEVRKHAARVFLRPRCAAEKLLETGGKMKEKAKVKEKKKDKKRKHSSSSSPSSAAKKAKAAEPAKKKPAMPPPPKDWWGWAVGFVPSGYMGDLQDEAGGDDGVGAERKRGFDEADQERLAMAAQDGANKGKRGLGTGTHVMDNPKNVAGGNWEGKKQRFDESGKLEGEQTEKKEKKQKKGKWGKTATKIVTKAGGKMGLKELLKKLTKKAGKEKSGGDDDLESEMRAELKACSSLVLGDSVVELKK